MEDKDAKNNIIDKLVAFRGIGPTKAHQLVKEGVKKMSDLRKAKYQSMLNEETKLALKYSIEDDIPWKTADSIIAELPPYLVGVGSYRRKKPILHDIDLLSFVPLEEVISDIKEVKGAVKIVGEYAAGSLKHSFILRYKGRYYHVDIFYSQPENKAAALLHYTGSSTFNIRVRAHAKGMGYKLNQYGLFKVMPDGSLKKIKVKTEKDILDYLGITYKSPSKRNE